MQVIPIVPDNRRSYTKETVLNWDEKVVHVSLSFLLEYSCLTCTDITNCYNSVYTHSVEWALLGKESSKQEVLGKTNKNQKEKKENVGKVIDILLKHMHYRQTNKRLLTSIIYNFPPNIRSVNLHSLSFKSKINFASVSPLNFERRRLA